MRCAIAPLTLIGLAALAVAACGDDQGGTPTASDAAQDSSAPAETDAARPDSTIEDGKADSALPDSTIEDGRPDSAEPDSAIEDGVTDSGQGDSTIEDGMSDSAEPDAPIEETEADSGQPESDIGDSIADSGGSLRPFAVEGFGAATVGGWQPGFDSYVVTSLDDSGPGTLRDGLDSSGGNPRVITFALDGTIALQSSLLVPSNLSIDGRGRRITITGKGLILVGSDDVILTNLTLQDVGPDSEDGVRIGDPSGASERVVLDHLSFIATGGNGDSKKVDEAISVIFGSTDVTLQWLRFDGWEKVMLFGNGDAAPAIDAAMRVTVHHSLATRTGRRHPQARYGIFDFYADFWDDWHMFDWFFASNFPESFGMQSQDGAFVMAQSVLFRRSTGPYDVLSQADEATRCESGGRLEAVDLAVIPGGNATLKFGVGCPAVVTPWTRPYAATIEPPDAALQQRLESEAGATL